MSKNKEILSLIAVSTAFFLFLVLGFWQLYRLGEKKSYIENIKNKFASEPLNLSFNALDNKEQNYTKWRLRGRFLYGHETFLYGSHPKKSELHGYFVLTPFLTESGNYILIKRGWIKPIDVDRFTKKQRLFVNNTNENIEIVGMKTIIEQSEQEKSVYNNNSTNNRWFYIDLVGMSNYLNIPINQRFYITLLSDDIMRNDLLTQFDTAFFIESIHNHHLIYATTWFSFALTILILYILQYKKQRIRKH